MTKEQYKVLKKYEQQLTAAAKNNFLRLSSAEFNELAGVYDGLFRPLRQSQRNCNTCRLNALKSLYNAYVGEKAQREVKEQEAQAAANASKKPVETKKTNNNTKTSPASKKTAGRPKKIDIEG